MATHEDFNKYHRIYVNISDRFKILIDLDEDKHKKANHS